MQTVQRYLLRDFLVNFGMALAVITMVLYLGAIMRGLDYVARGVPGGKLLQIFTLNIPYILSFSIPISTVVGTLLLFGRLSIDGEFTAMRSGGLSTWQIISPVVFAGAALSLICLVLQYEISPESRFARQKALLTLGELDPVDLLDEGRFVRFPNLEIYITDKDGHNLEDVEIYQLNEDGDTIQTVRAQTGEVDLYEDEKLMRVRLNSVQVQHPDRNAPEDLTRARIIDMETYEFDVSYQEMLKDNAPTRGIKDMRGSMLVDAIRDPAKYFPKVDERRQERNRMKALVEFHKRVGMSMACLSFTLLGIPLGMTSHRRESHSGIPIGLSMVIIFYTFIEVASSLRDQPQLFPDYIIWIPVILSQVAGYLMIRRIP
jgi:lipopolysaccharide export system permease protein